MIRSCAVAILLLAVPAAAGAQAQPARVETPVLVRTIEKGELLAAGDFSMEERPAAAARTAVAPRDAAGREAGRRLMAGTPIRAGDLLSPRAVRRGESVSIEVVSGTLTISTAGRALSDAGAGEPVRVLSLSTNRTLEGVAAAPGRVRVSAP